ncbi:hypothetical protein ACIRLA_21805 [Streptomyces sp. NPDC102364]|uniref:hypothetical protein n=1 Tax=Streptomyces sp. NPDC102364 TaxID=3366161 RepID=UPI00381C3B59
MATLVFNVALGRLGQYGDLPAAADSLILVPFAAAGLPTDATMRDYATLAAVKAGATEQTALGRKTLTNVTVTVDNTNDRVGIDCDDVTWTATSGAAIGAVAICYKPDTASADSAIIPLTKHDMTMTPDGNNFLLTVADFARITSAA